MLKNELLKLIETLKDEDNVDEIISKSDLAKSLIEGGLTLDAFKEKVKTDSSFKSYLDSVRETHFTKALETWKSNNLQKLIDEKIKELYPDKDPKDTELEKLRIEIENMKKESLKKELTNKAFKIATEKNLPVELVDFFIGENEEITTKNLETMANIFSKHDEDIKTKLLKDNSYTPPSGGAGGDVNPYAKETFSLTKQAELEKNDPEKARTLRELANKI